VKYAWAIALVIIFGIIVIIAVILFLVCWLFNRNRDKKQKQELLASTVPSPAQSQVCLHICDLLALAVLQLLPLQVSGAYPAYPPASVNNAYYPYVGGPSKYSGRY
jgi:heme/copper-type cytochrome/quinol oxidase subunit 2